MLNKRAEESTAINKIITVIIVLIVITLVLFLIFRVEVLAYFKNLPGFNEANTDVDVSNLRDIVAKDPCPVMIGKIITGNKISFCKDNIKCASNNMLESNLKYDGNKKVIRIDKKFQFDETVGQVVDNKISISSFDSDFLTKLNNAYFFNSNTICKQDETTK
ncbi:MAG: hypothetical protein Q7S33_05895 [Nanoarchaeota archaeon]|nr:hypothetical protein [Nanoarchaeota archaeon]